MSLIRRLVQSEMTGRNYRTDWYCPLPPQGLWFQVTDAEWTTEGELSVRKIYGWAVVPDYPAVPKLWPVSEHVSLRVVRSDS